jgi:hypothetical protein
LRFQRSEVFCILQKVVADKNNGNNLPGGQTSPSRSENFTWNKLHFSQREKLHREYKLFPEKIRLFVLTYQKVGIYVNIYAFTRAFCIFFVK